MKSEVIVFVVAAAIFGFIVGWVVGTQQAPARVVAAVSQAAATAGDAPAAAAPAPRPALDESQVAPLRAIAEKDPKNAQSRVQLGNLYFDAGQYQEAVKWYAAALALEPKAVDVSTDLAISYYYTEQPDLALKQMAYSLSVDPKHAKTWLNLGVVRAFGKQDMAGATDAWDQVIKLAPGSEEAQAAQRALDNLKAAHPGGTMPAAGAGPAAGASPSGLIKK